MDESLLFFPASCHQSPSTKSFPSTSLFSTKKIVCFAFFVVFVEMRCSTSNWKPSPFFSVFEEFAKMFSKVVDLEFSSEEMIDAKVVLSL